MFAGPFPNIAAGGQFPVVPNYANLENASIHQQVNTQGEKSSIYYAYSKDLKNVGAQFAFPTAGDGAGPGLGDKGAIVTVATRTNQVK